MLVFDLSLGILFSVIFTLPNYFQLKTVMKTSVQPFDSDSLIDQVTERKTYDKCQVFFRDSVISPRCWMEI